MKVGLFLDVDGVCTLEAVNLRYAEMLGIKEEHKILEKKFNDGEITTGEFGRRLVTAFREKQFTEERAHELIEKIEERPNTNKLFEIFDDVYIVSSAPSYYIKKFAKKYNVPDDRVMCSKYEFDDKGLISKCADPVSDQNKAEFVESVKDQYNIRIGVGDVIKQDAAFLGHCDVKILLGEYGAGYLSVRELPPVVTFLDSLKKRITFTESAFVDSEKFVAINKASLDLLKGSTLEQNVFIMTPFRKDTRYKLMIRVIKDELKAEGFNGWVASDKTLDPTDLWSDTQAFMLACKYGIAVFTEEQEGDITQLKQKAYNPNVSIELGFMLSRGREVLILKDKKLEKLMTDMKGFVYEEFNLEDPDSTLPPIIKRWVKDRLKKNSSVDT